MRLHVNRLLLAIAAVLVMPLISSADTAQFRAVFDVDWTAETFPVGFPSGAHFSTPIGGTHVDASEFWESEGIATRGIRNMAETGSRSALTSEVNAAIAAGDADSVVTFNRSLRARDLAHVDFAVNSDFPLVSLVTMIAPSPDWFVGVSGLSLVDESGWIGKQVIDLFAYDAGTDSGVNFTSSNSRTNPQVPIQRIVSEAFPEGVPLGTLSFSLLGDLSENGTLDAADIDLLSKAIRDADTDLQFDVNDDGDVDGDDRTFWLHELKNTFIGDANLDGAFGSSDLVSVLAAGEYEDAVFGNSTWSEGDWDGDQEFTTSDLLAAFADGGYEVGPRAATAVVPEPSGICFALLGVLGLLRIARQRSRAQ